MARELIGESTRNLPEGHMQCVWMLAGIIDYKLCDREYECEQCPFDQAIRGRVPSPPVADAGDRGASSTWGGRVGRFAVSGFTVLGTLFYTPAHVWVRVERGGHVRVGLDDFGQKLVGRVYAVSLPRPGTRVNPKSRSWGIAHLAGETSLKIPVSGMVREVNGTLAQQPSLVNRDPYGQGAAMVIEPKSLLETLKGTYYGPEVERWYQREIERLRRQLREFCEPQPDLGPTLPDGGVHLENLSHLISAANLRRVVESFLVAPARHPSSRRPSSRQKEG